MCGRVVMALDSETLVKIAGARRIRYQEAYKQSYNIPPTRRIPTVFRENSKLEENEIELMKFGMKNNENVEVINARAESIKAISMFRNMIINNNRCAVSST